MSINYALTSSRFSFVWSYRYLRLTLGQTIFLILKIKRFIILLYRASQWEVTRTIVNDFVKTYSAKNLSCNDRFYWLASYIRKYFIVNYKNTLVWSLILINPMYVVSVIEDIDGFSCFINLNGQWKTLYNDSVCMTRSDIRKNHKIRLLYEIERSEDYY